MRNLSITKAAEILGVEPSIKNAELKKVWRRLARRNHPDLHPKNEEQYKELAYAYETLVAYTDIARVAHEIDSDVLDDDLRFMLKYLPMDERQRVLKELEKLESESE